MNKNYQNLPPQEKKKQDEDLYQKFIILGIVPLFIYLMWPFIFGGNVEDVQAQVVENNIENVEEEVEERLDIDETTFTEQEIKVAPVVPVKPKRNKVQPGAIKKQPVKPVQPTNRQGFTLKHNVGDNIEYMVQNQGWKGVVQSKKNGSYTVKLTEIVTANAQQQYLQGNNPCFGGRPIGKNAKNQVITVPGACIHANK